MNMKEKQHIDDLFKGRLQNFEATPSPEVWNSIQAKMKKEKEDRKVIPIWWRLGGVAAMLALLLTIGNFVWNPFENSGETIVVNEGTNKDAVEKDETSIIPQTNTSKDAITSEEKIEMIEDASNDEEKNDAILRDNVVNESQQDQEAIADDNKSKIKTEANDNNLLKSKDKYSKKLNEVITTQDGVATNSEKNVRNASIKDESNTVKNNTAERNPLIKKDPQRTTENTVVTGVADNSNTDTESENEKDINNILL